MIINENSIQDTDNEKSRFTISTDENGGVAPAVDPPRNSTNGAEGTHHNEERENEPDDRTDDIGSTEESNRKDKYNLRNRDSIKLPSRYETCFTLFNEPISYQEAVSGEQSMNWKSAIQEELRAHEKNYTWTIISKPPDCNPIGCKWLFKVKEDPSTSKVRFKARLCAKGFSQKAGTDFEEIFSPVVRYNSVRVLMAMAASEDLEIGQFDVRTAFLHGKLKEVIYMQIPEGVKTDREEKVCKLNRPLYGLKQAARCWNQRFKDVLKEINFKVSEGDPCVFYGDFNQEKAYIALYVDDGLIFASSQETLSKILSALREKFEITEERPKSLSEWRSNATEKIGLS